MVLTVLVDLGFFAYCVRFVPCVCLEVVEEVVVDVFEFFWLHCMSICYFLLGFLIFECNKIFK